MILNPQFLIGVAVGTMLGVMLAPKADGWGFDLSDLQHAIMVQDFNSGVVTDMAKWPTDHEAKAQLFELSKWDIKKYGEGSTVSIERCISISEKAMACGLNARLSWINEPALIEGIFEGAPASWKLVKATTKRNDPENFAK